MKRMKRSVLCCVLLCALMFSATPGVSAAAQTVQGQNTKETLELIPGGVPFGVKFTTDGVLIVGFCDIQTDSGPQNPAREAGLRVRDVLTHINGQKIGSAEELGRGIAASGGNTVSIDYTRGGKAAKTSLTPQKDASGDYKTGLYVRDSGAGIGTVTFFVPETGAFAGLGHGICDTDTGELMPLRRGNVVGVTISGVNRGSPGAPGELRGYFSTTKDGTLLGNTACGVYGIYRQIPESVGKTRVRTATRDEVYEGEASVLCTLSSGERREYAVSISAINRDAKGSKCFTVKITDEALLAETGGIVQGMSGSPILQDGKLIGAITHVLVNNPTVGYGIFIENMLAAADIPLQKAA